MLKPETVEMGRYLDLTDMIDFDHELVMLAAQSLMPSNDDCAYARRAYEYVRDAFPHSFDLYGSGRPVCQVSCRASDVMINGHGICYAKSHLLAALLRFAGIPAGFCYQKLLSSEDNPKIVLHAVNAVFLKSPGKWIRLDARGNKNGVDAQFSINEEKLAFPIRPELGEEDGLIIYAAPSPNVLEVLKKANDIAGLIDNLPDHI
jgi:transglutaminase-like putative cysteine protease